MLSAMMLALGTLNSMYMNWAYFQNSLTESDWWKKYMFSDLVMNTGGSYGIQAGALKVICGLNPH